MGTIDGVSPSHVSLMHSVGHLSQVSLTPIVLKGINLRYFLPLIRQFRTSITDVADIIIMFLRNSNFLIIEIAMSHQYVQTSSRPRHLVHWSPITSYIVYTLNVIILFHTIYWLNTKNVHIIIIQGNMLIYTYNHPK